MFTLTRLGVGLLLAAGSPGPVLLAGGVRESEVDGKKEAPEVYPSNVLTNELAEPAAMCRGRGRSQGMREGEGGKSPLQVPSKKVPL